MKFYLKHINKCKQACLTITIYLLATSTTSYNSWLVTISWPIYYYFTNLPPVSQFTVTAWRPVVGNTSERLTRSAIEMDKYDRMWSCGPPHAPCDRSLGRATAACAGYELLRRMMIAAHICDNLPLVDQFTVSWPATPKSASLAWPSLLRRILPALMSLCIFLRSCRYSRPFSV